MTKTVRIENACNSQYRVQVEVWDKAFKPGEPDTLAEVHTLDFPTAMLAPTITSTRYLVVKEVQVEAPK